MTYPSIGYMVKLFVVVALIVSGILMYIGNKGLFSRFIINKVFPCVQNPGYSFPCNGVWDIGLMIFAVVVGIISIVVLGYLFFIKNQ